MPPAVNQATFCLIGRSIAGRIHNGHGIDRQFRALFGASPATILDIWLTSGLATTGVKPQHLMWAMMWAKVYATEPVLATLAGVTRKTFRKWVWEVVPGVAEVYPDVVSIVIMLILRCRAIKTSIDLTLMMLTLFAGSMERPIPR